MAKLKLTVETLRAAYDYLATCPPFVTLNLPESEEIEFRVYTSFRDFRAYYCRNTSGGHCIAVSSVNVKSTQCLMDSMAHEMIHLFLGEVDIEQHVMHGPAFHALATKVCRIHGFNRDTF